MVTRPTVHDPRTTVAKLRAFFSDDHVHIALLVDGTRLLGTIDRTDLVPALSAETRADSIAALAGRTVGPDTFVREAFDAMKRNGRRRLAVISKDSTLLGLLCLKQSGLGFCSDADVRNRNCANGS